METRININYTPSKTSEVFGLFTLSLSKTEKYFNVPFKGGAYISRIKINNQFTYIESNDMFDESEIRVLNNIAETFEKECIKQEKEVLKWYEEQNGKE